MLIAGLFFGAAAAGVIGALLVALFVVSPERPEFPAALTAGAASAGVMTIAAGAVAVLGYLGAGTLDSAWLGLAIAAALLTVLLLAVRSQPMLVVVALLAVGSVVSLALRAGAASSNRDVASEALGVQFVGAAAGIGVPLTLVLISGRLGRGRLRVLLGNCSGFVAACAGAVALGAALAAPLRFGGSAGVAAAITSPAASARDLESSTPAEILTGRPLPPPETLAHLTFATSPDAVWLVACGFGALGYLAGVVRLQQRGVAWPVARTVSWVAGILVLAYVTSGGLGLYAEFLFSTQLAARLALGVLVPLLLVPSAPVALAARAITPRADASHGAREWLILIARSRMATFCARPLVAGVLFVGSPWAFYYSAALRWATASPLGAQLAAAYFLAVGCLFVHSLLKTGEVGARRARLFRLAIVLVAMVSQALFGVLLMTTSGLLFAEWFGAMGRTWGPTPLADQHAAGVIALSAGELPLLALALAVVVPRGRRRARVVDGAREDEASDLGGRLAG